MYVYATPECKRKAKQYNVEDVVDKLCEEENPLSRFRRFSHVYLKKTVDRNLRLIAKLVETSEREPVLCLLDILKRGDAEYEKDFCFEPESFGENRLEPLLEIEQLREWLNEQQNLPEVSESQAQRIPEELRLWLERPEWGLEAQELVICESEEWVRRFKLDTIKLDWYFYWEIVFKLIENTSSESQELAEEETEWRGVKLCGNTDGRYVLFSRIETAETADTAARKVIFLLAPFNRKPAPKEIEEVRRGTNIFPLDSSLLSGALALKDLAPYARRSYPGYMLYDKESWREIECDDEANIALSAEEEQILLSVSAPGNKSLPIFINGRAGSGKSTILFYLFADYCARHQEYCQQQGKSFGETPHPLFLTYSKSLLEIAQKVVGRIVASHHKFVAKRTEESQKLSAENLQPLFKTFRDFILDLLPPDERDRFQPEKEISFYHFRELYKKCKLPEAKDKDCPPELCWHIIKTFIKGYDLDEEVDPEYYRSFVPRRERTVDPELFKKIYKTIWERWYKNLTAADSEGYWDDQDLVRKVLESGSYPHDYTAIFCDEAQDFTSLELKLIRQLSVFSQYDFGYQPVPSLPFAFAGDPFQTLNPTGFRWERVGSSFYSEVIANPIGGKKLDLEMNFQQLELNYRSSRPIVRLTNLIQLWRCVRFGLDDLKPQKPWQNKDSSLEPQKFILGENLSLEKLKAHIQKKPIFIIPCEAGGEIDYIRNDEVLHEIFPDVTEENPPENLYSAIKAKGLEFPLVVLYKFGDELHKRYSHKVVWDSAGERSDHLVGLEYFFNKLYVAASRAMSDLFVIDSKEGDRMLWQYAGGSEIERFLQLASGGANWKDLVGTLALGEDIAALDKDNRQSQAEQLKKRGMQEKDPQDLRAAGKFYRALGCAEEAKRCAASALKFDRQYREAGQLFLELGEQKLAWECFWDGLCWQNLLEWHLGDPEGKREYRPLVEFMAETPKTQEGINDFTEFLETLELEQLKENRKRQQWQKAVGEYAGLIQGLTIFQQVHQPNWQRFGDIVEKLAEARYSGMRELAGDCFFRTGTRENLERAVECWETCGATQKREYYLAKAELSKLLPERLEYLEKAKDFQRLLGEWERAGKPVTPLWSKYVEPILDSQKRYADLAECLIRGNQWLKAIEVLEKHPETASLGFYVVRELAGSNLAAENFLEDMCRRYERFISTHVLANPNWLQHVSAQDVGAALEKTGELVATLKFYEGFTESRDQTLKQLARQRWLKNKIKQADYHQNKGETNRSEEIRAEILRKANEWRISTARLICRHAGAPVREFFLDGSSRYRIGRFSSEAGRDDIIDLQKFPQGEYISRSHAEIYQEGGEWKVLDTGSRAGVFIQRAGQERRHAKVDVPEIIKAGDEVVFATIPFLFQTP
ncbi:FHA domain-containing protein [Kamptonema formosum]|uniref:FHA domain-containing protein n=1 Tax=Kamptonema formosum TaxID=331992 RepID=UPI0003457276|nr:FHA domain-containing protein [Oscillatoria sp. PCC 10802]